MEIDSKKYIYETYFCIGCVCVGVVCLYHDVLIFE